MNEADRFEIGRTVHPVHNDILALQETARKRREDEAKRGPRSLGFAARRGAWAGDSLAPAEIAAQPFLLEDTVLPLKDKSALLLWKSRDRRFPWL